MELKGSLTCSQKPSIWPYRQQTEFSWHAQTYFFKINFSSILPSALVIYLMMLLVAEMI
jgi:hypothetical protein